MISKDKSYRTRGGDEVRIYAIDGGGEYCVHGAIKTASGWFSHEWTPDGRWKAFKLSKFDLVEDYSND